MNAGAGGRCTHGRGGAAALAVALLAGLPCQGALPPQLADGTPLPSLAPMVERATPAVVNIATYASVRAANPLLDDPFFRRFFSVPDGPRRYRRAESAGSGVIVDAGNGYIITNHHVIARADEIAVGLADGRALQAELVGIDPEVDLAVLQVAAEGLTALPFADSAALKVGDFVVAVGNPFGLEQTVTSGIVSALGRHRPGAKGFADFIQTDASINPGNSGGALLNLAGELVGINTAIVSPRGAGSVGIGFAIPSDMASAIMRQLVAHGEVRRGRLGLVVQALGPELAAAFGLAGGAQGVVVADVAPGGAADAAGLQAGDIIRAMRGRVVRRLSDYRRESALVMEGDVVRLSVLRDGEEQTLAVAVVDAPVADVAGGRVDPRLAGASLSDFRDADTNEGAGVIVAQVAPGSRAARQGLRAGDIVIAANRRQTRDIGDLWRQFRDARSVRLRVYRAGRYGDIDVL